MAANDTICREKKLYSRETSSMFKNETLNNSKNGYSINHYIFFVNYFFPESEYWALRIF